MGRLPCLLLVLPLLLAAVEKEAKTAPPPVPGDQEAGLLIRLNAFREEVARAQVPVVRMMQDKAIPANASMWARSMGTQKGAPPLVFDPLLMSAARSLLAENAAPVDKQPIPFADALRDAGYAPDGTGLVMIAREAPSLPLAFALAITQVVGERQIKANYSIPTYAAASAVDPVWREAGIAVRMGKNGACSLVMVLGAGSAKRYIGGFAFADANRNGRWDPGEGRAGVQITAGTATMTTGPAGAWWLGLQGDGVTEVTFAGAGQQGARPVAAGTGNLAIDWRVPNAADLKLADGLIAEAEKDPAADPAKRRKALAALLAGTRMAVLDDARQAKVTALVQPIQAEFDDLVRQAMAALAEEAPVFKERMAKARKAWDGSLPKLFKEFDSLYALRQQVTAVLAAPAERQAALAAPALKQVDKACAESTDPLCLAQLETWHESLAEIVPAETKKR